MDRARMAAACAAGFVGGTWLFFSSFRRLKLRRAIEGTPTSKARSAAMGKCELKGSARALDKPLTAPFSGKPCVWYAWKVEEEYRDSKGNSYWRTIADGQSFEAFLIEDETGGIKIEPRGAEVEALLSQQFKGGFLFNSLAPGPEAARWMRSDRRLSERRIPPQSPLYALGVLRSLGEPPLPVLCAGRSGEPFFLAARSEEELDRELFWSVSARMLGGACLSVGSLAAAAAVFFAH